MQAYERKLSNRLIQKLNEFYENERSWWHKIVEDRQTFILIRSNHLRVLVHGGLLLMVRMNRAGDIVCKTHEEYLSLRTEKDPYAILEEDRTQPFKTVQGLRGFEEHYSKIKRRIRRFVGNERHICQELSLRMNRIVDKEVGLVKEAVGETTSKSAQAVDLGAIADKGKLVLLEVKLFENKEIRSAKTPSVVKQLRKYEKIIKHHEQKILNAFKDQFELYSQLKGRFFRQKKKLSPQGLSIYPRVRLIITDFDSAQRDTLLPNIRKRIEDSMGWEENSPDLITVGLPQKINENHLFKGI